MAMYRVPRAAAIERKKGYTKKSRVATRRFSAWPIRHVQSGASRIRVVPASTYVLPSFLPSLSSLGELVHFALLQYGHGNTHFALLHSFRFLPF